MLIRRGAIMLLATLVLAGCGGGGGLLGTHFVQPENIKSKSAYQLTGTEKAAFLTEVRKGIGFSEATWLRGRQRKVVTKDGRVRIELCAVVDLHSKTLFGGRPITWLVRAQFPKGQHKGMYVRVPAEAPGMMALRRECKRAGLFPG